MALSLANASAAFFVLKNSTRHAPVMPICFSASARRSMSIAFIVPSLPNDQSRGGGSLKPQRNPVLRCGPRVEPESNLPDRHEDRPTHQTGDNRVHLSALPFA